MSVNHKVSVGWQIVFTFIIGLNFWAFYRIRKLRKYVLYVIVPSAALSAVSFYYAATYPRFTSLDNDTLAFGDPYMAGVVSAVTTLISLALQGLSIYLVIIWSREHNKAFDAPPTQAPQD